MALTSNFFADYAAGCLQRLQEAGYTVDATDNRSIVRTYLSIRHRRVKTSSRTFHQGPYSVPQALAIGHAMLKDEVEKGKDLWPRQSRKITKSAVEDAMLNDFGIQHFHLGTQPDRRHAGLIEGTPELLFAIVTKRDFYAIGLYDHAGWALQALLDVVHAHWPHLLASVTIKNATSLAVTYSDQEVAALRKEGINAVTRRADGTIQAGLGGGVATDGTSVAVTRDLIRLEGFIQEYERLVLSDFEDKVRDGTLKDGSKVRLIWRGERAYAASGNFEMDLLGNLPVPPL